MKPLLALVITLSLATACLSQMSIRRMRSLEKDLVPSTLLGMTYRSKERDSAIGLTRLKNGIVGRMEYDSHQPGIIGERMTVQFCILRSKADAEQRWDRTMSRRSGIPSVPMQQVLPDGSKVGDRLEVLRSKGGMDGLFSVMVQDGNVFLHIEYRPAPAESKRQLRYSAPPEARIKAVTAYAKAFLNRLKQVKLDP